jgi:hypothetical protein
MPFGLLAFWLSQQCSGSIENSIEKSKVNELTVTQIIIITMTDKFFVDTTPIHEQE